MNRCSIYLHPKLNQMSPRPKRRRILSEPPAISGFMPESGDYSFASEDTVILFFEEYESIRLADYEYLTQLEASKRMRISMPTFTRIYESARRKVAKAFVENKRISIEGGHVEFDANWYRCDNCGTVFKRKSEQQAENVSGMQRYPYHPVTASSQQFS